jgi:hypothetical protein
MMAVNKLLSAGCLLVPPGRDGFFPERRATFVTGFNFWENVFSMRGSTLTLP